MLNVEIKREESEGLLGKIDIIKVRVTYPDDVLGDDGDYQKVKEIKKEFSYMDIDEKVYVDSICAFIRDIGGEVEIVK